LNADKEENIIGKNKKKGLVNSNPFYTELQQKELNMVVKIKVCAWTLGLGEEGRRNEDSSLAAFQNQKVKDLQSTCCAGLLKA